MASILRELHVNADANAAWDALRDFGNVHRRVARGFVTETREEGDDRIVTFVNGAVARERLVAADDEHRRLVYSVVESSFGLTHHQASVEVIPSADGATLRWITDVLPDTAAEPIGSMMDAGAEAIRATLA
jgi:hypothetical protein